MKQKFEHCVETLIDEYAEDIIKEREKDGWELVVVTPRTWRNSETLFFKRPQK